jgi:amino acid transporter
MADGGDSTSSAGTSGGTRAFRAILVSSALFAFISYWRTAAVILCDLGSTAYYIGGIVEQAIGPAAPWFILAVMLFSYAVRSVYIESCSMFVRGGVYKVVKEALGGFMGKLSVSALLFDYVLTGPISAVSAGQYVVGLLLDTVAVVRPEWQIDDKGTKDAIKQYGSVLIAVGITLYFFRQNLLGIRQSSDKALKIMMATTVMVVVMIVWCGITLAVRGPANRVPLAPDLSEKVEYQVEEGKDAVTGQKMEKWVKDPETGKLVPEVDDEGNPKPRINEITGRQDDPLGFAGGTRLAEPLRDPQQVNWLSLIGAIGIVMAFGHAILAMSGEETLAQVYREVKAPKLPNFERAAFIVFLYSLVFTGGISFLAVLLIPDSVRMKEYSDNLIAGLAMNVVGPSFLLLLLHAFVVVVGFLILSGAVNTAILGSNGVLNRVAEDGVLPDWFLEPHPRHGTTHRTLYLILALQLITIVISRGNVLLLGEAYAFGVVWSFLFKTLAMIVLRFRDTSRRKFQVPLNFRLGGVQIPLGLTLIFLVLLAAGVANLFTKQVATLSGLAFTAVFMVIFLVTERYYGKGSEKKHEHLEQFNQQAMERISSEALALTGTRRCLVVVRSPQHLVGLEKILAETDPETTDLVVVGPKTAKADGTDDGLSDDDRRLMTAVVDRIEREGKGVTPLLVPAGELETAAVQIAQNLRVQEMVFDDSEGDDLFDRIATSWGKEHEGRTQPLTVRRLGANRDERRDLGGEGHIPGTGKTGRTPSST